MSVQLTRRLYSCVIVYLKFASALEVYVIMLYKSTFTLQDRLATSQILKSLLKFPRSWKKIPSSGSNDSASLRQSPYFIDFPPYRKYTYVALCTFQYKMVWQLVWHFSVLFILYSILTYHAANTTSHDWQPFIPCNSLFDSVTSAPSWLCSKDNWKHSYLITPFRCILISRFPYVENWLHFNFADFPVNFIEQFVSYSFSCLKQMSLSKFVPYYCLH